MSWTEKVGQSLATFGMYGALYTLCGFYILNRRRKLVDDLNKFAVLLGSVVVTVALCWAASKDQWRAEIIPLMLFGMTAAIAYEKELALLLAASVSLIVAFSLDQGLAEFVILVSSVAAAILLLQRVRSRTKLIYVGTISGVVVVLTTLGVGTLVGQAFGATDGALNVVEDWFPKAWTSSFILTLAVGSLWFGACSLLASVLMTGLLPFIERVFDVQTDISLLELGDVQHPLLQQLVRRAPGTYNHSINVASIAETAAESIGCNGLLVRVGAYFHDIGKMLKPAYFVENQGLEGNRHEFLQPAMSTLVIIAHVKDGADLARQHHLPRTIIDFIEQHHGTTLVEYFYRREAKRLESDPSLPEPDESTFRYPGPKPQTKETAVLMLADVVESASRALSDPTPARIESLVHDLALKRLLDGQFDECGLTLQELRTIEDSLVKSLTAVYHGRVKYPEHQTV
jgi:putative nucleotidyltransferase with HDIG domain